VVTPSSSSWPHLETDTSTRGTPRSCRSPRLRPRRNARSESQGPPSETGLSMTPTRSGPALHGPTPATPPRSRVSATSAPHSPTFRSRANRRPGAPGSSRHPGARPPQRRGSPSPRGKVLDRYGPAEAPTPRWRWQRARREESRHGWA
jgi:hypothetical protein